MRPAASRARSASMPPARCTGALHHGAPVGDRCARVGDARTPASAFDGGTDHCPPFLLRQLLGLTPVELPAVHRAIPSELYIEPALREEPEALLRPVIPSGVGIEQERDLSTGEISGEALDFQHL